MATSVFGPAGGCCGCDEREYPLFPDLFNPIAIRSLVTTTDGVYVTTTTRTRRYHYVDNTFSHQTDVTVVETVGNLTPVVTETIDEEPIYGTFRHNFNGISTGAQTGSLIVVEGSIESGTWVQQQLIITTRAYGSLVIRRRLIVQFDVSDQFRFGLTNPDAAHAIESSHVRATITNYLDPQFQEKTPLKVNGQPLVTFTASQFILGGTAKGFLSNTALPSTPTEFDNQFGTAANLRTLTSPYLPFDVKSWLPGSPNDPLVLSLYFDATSEFSSLGGQIPDLRMAIADRKFTLTFHNNYSLVSQLYDWRRDWRIIADDDDFIFQSVNSLPTDNYLLTINLETNYFSREGRELRVSFYDASDWDEDNLIFTDDPLFSQHFYMDIGSAIPIDPVLDPDPDEPRYPWELVSESEVGYVVHERDERRFDEWPDPIQTFTTTRSFAYLIQGASLQTPGGNRMEDGARVTYETIPYWHDYRSEDQPDVPDQPLPKLLVRVEHIGPLTRPDTWTRSGIRHAADRRNLKCPDGTCPATDDYAHPEWRVKSISVPNFDLADWAEGNITHVGCTTTMYSEEGTSPGALKLRWINWYWRFTAEATYEPPQPIMHWPAPKITDYDLPIDYQPTPGALLLPLFCCEVVGHYPEGALTINRAADVVSGGQTKWLAVVGTLDPEDIAPVSIPNEDESFSEIHYDHSFVLDTNTGDSTWWVEATSQDELAYDEEEELPEAFRDRQVLLTVGNNAGMLFLCTDDDPITWEAINQLFAPEYPVAPDPPDYTVPDHGYYVLIDDELHTWDGSSFVSVTDDIVFPLEEPRAVVRVALTVEYLDAAVDFRSEIDDVVAVGVEVCSEYGWSYDDSDPPEIVHPGPPPDHTPPTFTFPATKLWSNTDPVTYDEVTLVITVTDGFGDSGYLVTDTITSSYFMSVDASTTLCEAGLAMDSTPPWTPFNAANHATVYSDAWDRMMSLVDASYSWLDSENIDYPYRIPSSCVVDVVVAVTETFTLRWVRLVDKWRDRQLPDLSFLGSETYSSTNIRRYVSATANPSSIPDNLEPVRWVDIHVTSETVSVSGTSLVLEGSKYEP